MEKASELALVNLHNILDCFDIFFIFYFSINYLIAAVGTFHLELLLKMLNYFSQKNLLDIL